MNADTESASQRQKLGILDLPPEVRHEIYKHLFCHKRLPISLGAELILPSHAPPFMRDDELAEPTFYTEIFRLNKAISRDALQFAYGANTFRLVGDVTPFCSLGSTALASIKTLTIFNNSWLSGTKSGAVWNTLCTRCTGLELLIVRPSSHLLLGAIPYLKDFVASIPGGQNPPRIQLSLNLLDRHFSFDFPDREYRRALQELNCKFGDEERKGLNPREAVMRMPKHVKQIDLVLDVSPDVVQALDEFLLSSPQHRLVKAKEPPECVDHQRVGRRTGCLYIWEDGDR